MCRGFGGWKLQNEVKEAGSPAPETPLHHGLGVLLVVAEPARQGEISQPMRAAPDEWDTVVPVLTRGNMAVLAGVTDTAPLPLEFCVADAVTGRTVHCRTTPGLSLPMFFRVCLASGRVASQLRIPVNDRVGAVGLKIVQVVRALLRCTALLVLQVVLTVVSRFPRAGLVVSH